MKTSGLLRVIAGLLVLGQVGCGETERNEPTPFPAQSGSHSGGQAAVGGTTTQAGGSVASAGQAGAAAGTGGNADTSTLKPTPVTGPITKVFKSEGCGKPYIGDPSYVKRDLPTMGVKAADCADQLAGQPICGPWAATRTYNLYLPPNYDPERAYSLVIEAPGCGGNSSNVPALNNNVDNWAIRVGVAPGPNSLGHATNPNQGCFDTHEGDDSIDWVMYEQLYDKLNAELCFDRNRVFVGGHSSGAWFANELGCKYAGDTLRPVRAVLPNEGGQPTDPRYSPTCTSSPLAGLWVHEVDNATTPFALDKVAIDRAISLSCPDTKSFDTALLRDFPIGGGKSPDTCKFVTGCDPLHPIVVCPLPGHSQSSHEDVVNPGWSTFIKLFQQGAFVTQ